MATDGSDASEAAVDHACRLVERTGGSVSLVHAVNPTVSAEGGSRRDGDRLVQSVADAEERGERLLTEGERRVTDRGVDVADTHLLYGEPTEEIPALAAEESYDGIVVGHRGLSDRYERVLGSVAKGLVGRTDIPVTVVRDD
ncbi:universal stress protein [Halobaculum sp. MBLA0143]|uniref:universal stress protein n=1 Tax=Halobaculum sp. MBLA0143 TaxID=3079933 RepID=UPI0035269C6E